jgi:hypothetical protein
MDQVPFKVLLPNRIWEQRSNKEIFKTEVKKYMERYPHYKVLKVADQMAWCQRIEVNEG